VTNQRVVVLLSGGGAKAAAHVGALRALTEARLAPAHIVATSMGAVMGAGFAAGLAPDEILARCERVGAKGIVRSPWAPWGGLWLRSLLRGEPLRAAIGELLPVQAFEQLTIPLTVTAVDLDSGSLVLFGAGGQSASLIDALWASCALPVFYPPVLLGGRRLVDGGLRGVVPFGAAAGIPADLVVAIDVGPGLDEAEAPVAARYPPLIEVHNQTTGVLMAAITTAELARWRAEAGRPELLYVRPRVEREATFRIDRAREYADDGYRATAAVLENREPAPALDRSSD
jgi:NTE family protein